jgi:hypothetical protein
VAEEQEQPKPISVYDVIVAMMDQMAAIAWSKLGLQPDMVTGAISQDLEEAKVAIDVASQLSAIVEPRLDESDRRELHNLVRNLRLNYVQKSQETK